MPLTSNPARALVFVNGDCEPLTLTRCAPLAADFILCVDGGLRHCLAADLQPDLLVGDLDSASTTELDSLRERGVEIQRWPVRKDATDLELALDALVQLQQREQIAEVVMLGMAGGRLDQSLANILQLTRVQWPFEISLLTPEGDAWLLQGPRQWQQSLAPGTLVSLLALGAGSASAATASGLELDHNHNDCTGVCTTGLEYPLHNGTLQLGSSLGLSNVVAASADTDAAEVSVTLQRGNLLLIVNPADPDQESVL